ncbi:unnamed protein product [Rhodiola kirilowii]
MLAAHDVAQRSLELEKKRKEESQLAYEKKKQLNKLKIKAEKADNKRISARK